MKKVSYTKIEPIHEMDREEINHILEVTWQQIEPFYTHPNIKPEKTFDPFEWQIDFNLKTLAHSIKKSLIYIYPEKERDLSEVTDAKKAYKYKQLIEASHIIPTPLYEGIDALVKIYLELGPWGQCKPDDLDLALYDFRNMERAVKDYTLIAEKYYLKKRAKEQSAEAGSQKTRLQGIIEAIEKYKNTNDKPTFGGFWNFISKSKYNRSKPYNEIDGYSLFVEGDKLYHIDETKRTPKGKIISKVKSIEKDSVERYYYEYSNEIILTSS